MVKVWVSFDQALICLEERFHVSSHEADLDVEGPFDFLQKHYLLCIVLQNLIGFQNRIKFSDLHRFIPFSL